LSPRNREVAATLNEAGLATLLFDLLTEEEGRERERVFDIPLLARRLEGVTRRALAEPDTRGLPIGYFGASTGAAAALRAAAAAGDVVQAVVSRGGRPDLPDRALNQGTTRRGPASPPKRVRSARAAESVSGGGRCDRDRLLLRLRGERDRHFDDAVARGQSCHAHGPRSWHKRQRTGLRLRAGDCSVQVIASWPDRLAGDSVEWTAFPLDEASAAQGE
jgi:pimeloyl-ACP methyl ester carboxylesterase